MSAGAWWGMRGHGAPGRVRGTRARARGRACCTRDSTPLLSDSLALHPISRPRVRAGGRVGGHHNWYLLLPVWDDPPAQTGLAFRFGGTSGTPVLETFQVRVALGCCPGQPATCRPLGLLARRFGDHARSPFLRLWKFSFSLLDGLGDARPGLPAVWRREAPSTHH